MGKTTRKRYSADFKAKVALDALRDIPMRRGFLYFVAIMDWASRKVLAWRLSNTMAVEFCVEALEEALARYGKPEIFNTDQGSQFTSPEFTNILKNAGVRISMDGKGRWMDNVFIERLWRSLKYECVYLHAFETASETRAGIGRWIAYYNSERPHSTFDGQTPDGATSASARWPRPDATIAAPAAAARSTRHVAWRRMRRPSAKSWPRPRSVAMSALQRGARACARCGKRPLPALPATRPPPTSSMMG